MRNDFQPFPLPISNNKILQNRDIKTMVHFVFFALSLKRYLWSRIEERGLRGASFFSFQAFTGLMAVFPGLMAGNIVLMARSFSLCLVVVNADLFTFHPTLDFSEDFSEEKHSISVTLNPEIRTFVNKPTVKGIKTRRRVRHTVPHTKSPGALSGSNPGLVLWMMKTGRHGCLCLSLTL